MEERTFGLLVFGGLFLALAAFVAWKAERQEDERKAQGKPADSSHSPVL